MKKIYVFVCCLIALASIPTFAQTFPNKPIRLIVGYAAGGGADALARLTATQLTESLGQQVFVENRAGAGGTLAADAVAKAPADGYTLLFWRDGSVDCTVHLCIRALRSDQKFCPRGVGRRHPIGGGRSSLFACQKYE